MKRIVLVAFICLVFTGTAFAQSRTFYTSIAPVSSTYQSRVEDGVINWERTDVSKKGTAMAFNGTSPCQVIDLGNPGLVGYMTFQMKSLMSSSGVSPTTGTTLSVFWKGSNVDSPAAWDAASGITVFHGMNANTGATNIVYDLNYTTGVTPTRYMRFDFRSGVSSGAGTVGAGNLVPVGILFVR